MYLGRVKRGDWVTVLHSKYSVRTEVVRGMAFKLDDMRYPYEDIPDWRESHTELTYDADANPSVSPVPMNYQATIIGYFNPTVSLITLAGSKVIDDKKMKLLDRRTNASLFMTEIFIGDDIPEGPCILRTEYVASVVNWNVSVKKVYPAGLLIEGSPTGPLNDERELIGGVVWEEGSIRSQHDLGTFAALNFLEVLPSGSPKGTYLNSHFYERPQATYLLGQYDSDTIDFRRNARTTHGK